MYLERERKIQFAEMHYTFARCEISIVPESFKINISIETNLFLRNTFL